MPPSAVQPGVYGYPAFDRWGETELAPLGGVVLSQTDVGCELAYAGPVTGRQEFMRIAPGVTLHLSNVSFAEECAFRARGEQVVTFAFRLCGRSYDRFDGEDEHVHSGAYFSLARQSGVVEFERRFPKGQRLEAAFVIGEADALRRFMEVDAFDRLLDDAEEAEGPMTHHAMSLNGVMCDLLGQLDRRDFTGDLRRAFLQAKAKALMCEALGRLDARGSPLHGTRYAEALERARAVLDREYDREHSLAALASRVALSRTNLACGFREQFGCTIGEYLFRARMRRTLDLLDDTTLTLSDIAERVGYDSVYSLSRAFKRRFGVSPRGLSHRGGRATGARLRSSAPG